MEPKYYSISQINCYRGCKQAWSYRYREKLMAKTPQRPLYIGSTIHKLLEIRANGQDWKEYLHTQVKKDFDSMPSTYQAVLGEDFVECCEKIMRQYDWVWKDENIRYLATEVKIDTKIRGHKRFVGVVDAIVEIDGKMYIMEHKTFKTTKMSMEQTWLNQQTCLYAKVLSEKGYRIEGVVWDMIKTAAYDAPRVLKDGSFGKQYGNQTIMSFLDAGCSEDTIPSSIYEDIKLNHLNFVDRYITPLSQQVIDSVWNDFVETVNEISRDKGHAKNIGRSCEWCSYKDLCQTELTGGDVEYTKQLLYTTPLQREKDTLEKFKQTQECIQCQNMASEHNYDIDWAKCIDMCPLYKKFKEQGENQHA